MQNPYVAVLGISYIALVFVLGATLIGIPLFGGAPCAAHPGRCAQTAAASR